MNYKINVDNYAHKRYINYGLKTHDYNRTEQEDLINNERISIVTTITEKKNVKIQQSLVVLDSASILGKHFVGFTKMLENNDLVSIYIVGDTCFESDYIKSKTNIKLLYKQGINNVFEVFDSHGLFKYFINGNLPGIVYFCRDIVKQPRIVYKILTKSKSILFAGQDGESSIKFLLSSHIENSENLEIIQQRLSLSLKNISSKINKFTTIKSISKHIIELTSEFSDIIEKTDYALDQKFFKEQRMTILFKSFFRFFMIKYMESKEILTVIKYPKEYLRIYNSKFYNRNYFIDFGGVNGYESLYPRMADIIYNQLQYFQFNQDELRLCQLELDTNCLETYIKTQIGLLNSLVGLD
jgi:hypothetical protein